MLYSLLLSSAAAHDLEIQVKVPGGDPVWTTLLDVRPGSTQTITFPGGRRTVYRLQATVDAPPTDGYDWGVSFELTSSARKGADPTVVMRPRMEAHTNESAQVTMGGTEPVVGSEAPAVVFHGYEIEWIVRDGAAP